MTNPWESGIISCYREWRAPVDAVRHKEVHTATTDAIENSGLINNSAKIQLV